MRRQDKYPDTTTFHFYNANPHGRFSGDCVIRAVSTALNQTWEQTLKEMCDIGIKYGYVPSDEHVIEKYMKNKGWLKCGQPRKDDNTKYTGDEFCRKLQHPIYSDDLNLPACNIDRILANIGGHHIVAIVEGRVNDIWDSTDKCIGKVWVKPVR